MNYQYGHTLSADELKKMADEVSVPEGSCPENFCHHRSRRRPLLLMMHLHNYLR